MKMPEELYDVWKLKEAVKIMCWVDWITLFTCLAWSILYTALNQVCHMLSSPILEIHSCGSMVITISLKQAHLLQRPSFLQYVSMVVMQ